MTFRENFIGEFFSLTEMEILCSFLYLKKVHAQEDEINAIEFEKISSFYFDGDDELCAEELCALRDLMYDTYQKRVSN